MTKKIPNVTQVEGTPNDEQVSNNRYGPLFHHHATIYLNARLPSKAFVKLIDGLKNIDGWKFQIYSAKGGIAVSKDDSED